MTNDPDIQEGLILLRRIFERAAYEYEYTSPSEPQLKEKSKVSLGDVLPDIEVTGDIETGITLSFEFKTPTGEKRSGTFEADDLLTVDARRKHWSKPLLMDSEEKLRILKDAIEYRKNSYGFG